MAPSPSTSETAAASACWPRPTPAWRWKKASSSAWTRATAVAALKINASRERRSTCVVGRACSGAGSLTIVVAMSRDLHGGWDGRRCLFGGRGVAGPEHHPACRREAEPAHRRDRRDVGGDQHRQPEQDLHRERGARAAEREHGGDDDDDPGRRAEGPEDAGLPEDRVSREVFNHAGATASRRAAGRSLSSWPSTPRATPSNARYGT